MKHLFPLFAFCWTAWSWAAGPYYLDRQGVLWKAQAEPSGMVLTATREGVELLRAEVPFALGIAGRADSQMQVAADELTGTVAVVWQRNWTERFSEIFVALWKDGAWQRVERLTPNLEARPRNPLIRLSRARTTYQVPAEDPDAPPPTATLEESFLHVLWWEGEGQGQRAKLATFNLSLPPEDPQALLTADLSSLLGLGIACLQPLPPEILEHPTFAGNGTGDRAMIFFGSPQNCLFQLVDVRFRLEDPPQQGGIGVVAQRKRHMPIFGVRRVLPAPQELSLEGARVVVGENLEPVIFRVHEGRLEYVVATSSGWSPKRTLNPNTELTLEAALALVENLAR